MGSGCAVAATTIRRRPLKLYRHAAVFGIRLEPIYVVSESPTNASIEIDVCSGTPNPQACVPKHGRWQKGTLSAEM
jgi:hypothetical protein